MGDFQRYAGPGTGARPTGATMTVTKGGQLKLSPEAVELLGRPTAVSLLWDAEDQVLGVEAATGDVAGRLRLVLALRDDRTVTNATIGAKGFLDWAGVDHTSARRWPAALNADGILCADLTQPGVPVTSNRARIATRPSSAGAMPQRRPRTMDRPDATPL